MTKGVHGYRGEAQFELDVPCLFDEFRFKLLSMPTDDGQRSTVANSIDRSSAFDENQREGLTTN